jgi:hypothetical protein
MNALVFFLAVSVVAADDPVSGSMLYLPKIGEKAVLHDYDAESGMVVPDVQAWTNTTALAKYLDGFETEEFKRERTKVLGNPKELAILEEKQRDLLLKGPQARGEVVSLPDMTPVRVWVLASFYKAEITLSFSVIVPDNILVEVLSGPMKGRFFWVHRHFVRVPGAKAPDPFSSMGKFPNADFGDDADKTPMPESAPAVSRVPSASLLVEDSSWNRLTDFVQVHCRVRNLTDHPIEDISMKVIYEDAAGRLVYAGNAIVGTLKPGEVKTCSSFDKHDPRMQRYNFEFEGRENGERGGIPFTTNASRGRRSGR